MCGRNASPAQDNLVGEMQLRVKAKNHTAALDHLTKASKAEQRNHVRTPYMFNLMIREAANGSDFSGAEFWLHAMEDFNVTPNVHSFVPILNMLAEAGDMKTLDAYMSKMKSLGVEHNMFTYSSYIKACSTKGDVKRAEKVLAEMKEAGVGVSHVSYNSLIHTCAKAGQISKAETYLMEMMHAGVEPTLITYNTVINACATDGDTNRAEFWLQYMTKRGMTPNAVTFGTICKAFAHKGDVEKVESTMEQYTATGQELNEYFYASLLTAIEKSHPLNKERAESIYAQMAKKNLCIMRVIKPLTRILGGRRVDQLRRQAEKANAAGNAAGSAPKSEKASAASRQAEKAANRQPERANAASRQPEKATAVSREAVKASLARLEAEKANVASSGAEKANAAISPKRAEKFGRRRVKDVAAATSEPSFSVEHYAGTVDLLFEDVESTDDVSISTTDHLFEEVDSPDEVSTSDMSKYRNDCASSSAGVSFGSPCYSMDNLPDYSHWNQPNPECNSIGSFSRPMSKGSSLNQFANNTAHARAFCPAFEAGAPAPCPTFAFEAESVPRGTLVPPAMYTLPNTWTTARPCQVTLRADFEQAQPYPFAQPFVHGLGQYSTSQTGALPAVVGHISV